MPLLDGMFVLPRLPRFYVERLKGVVWTDVMLAVSFLSCLLTPIEVGVVQDVDFGSALFVVLLLCDAVAVLDVYYALEQNVWAPFALERARERSRVERLYAKGTESGVHSGGAAAAEKVEHGTTWAFFRFLSANSIPNKGVIVLRALSAAPFFVLPIGGLLGVPGEPFYFLLLHFSLAYFIV